WAEISSPRSARSAMASIASTGSGLPRFAFISLALLGRGMPCRHDPQIVSDRILAVLHNERDQASLPKTNHPLLFALITTLVFNVGRPLHLVLDGNVELSSLSHLLSFRCIPAYPHRRLSTLSGHFELTIV